MPSGPDIVVYSPDHQIQLVVEVKGITKSDAQWAAEFRRNLLDHAAIPASPYFMLVAADQLYLWSQPARDPASLPDFNADTYSVLQRFLPLRTANQPHVSGRGLELAMTTWLEELARSTTPPPETAKDMRWLEESGLYQGIHAGSITTEPMM